jgi:SPP1 gp7 family putative phage head morphogenesis protein
MLELDFDVFIDHLEHNRKLKGKERRQVHYLEEPSKFTLYIKSVDLWEYFTSIPMSQVFAFGSVYGVSEEEAVKDFKTNFLYDAMPLKKQEVEVVEIVDDSLFKEVGTIEEEEDAEDLEDFLKKKFSSWENKVFSFVDSTLKSELQKGAKMDKSFGEFLQRLFNTVNTADFLDELKRVVKKSFKKGISDVEKEVNVDIGFKVEFDPLVDYFAKRQLEGFHIEGKMWPGLKGVSEDVRDKVQRVVEEGIVHRRSRTSIKEDIKKIFIQHTGDETTEGRAMMIARTESTRVINQSKIAAFKDTGLPGVKVWNATNDKRTSKICSRLDKQKVNIDQQFVDELTGKQFQFPPAHVNCRSTINFELIE